MFSVSSHIVGPTGLKFGMEDHIWGGYRIHFIQVPPSPGSGSLGPYSLNGAFLGNFQKATGEGHP